jgi:hypothetical protein
MSDVVVYVATGCHLCPPAIAAAEAACAPRGLQPRIIDIDGVLELEHAYRQLIPVVMVDGVEVGHYVITEGELAAVLDRTHS